jgi:pimeloyl-ACP methyl ester carboxylesterase
MLNQQVSANGLSFNLIEAGSSTGQLVLFLHGFPQFADSWLPILQPVAGAGFHAVAFDQRGYSPAARPPNVEDYRIEFLVSDTLTVADALGHSRFHLVAHDWGGLVAWQIAGAHPERLHSLTVLATPHTNAFLHALKTNLDQMNRSKYILFFKAPGHVAEKFFLADDAAQLRRVYQAKVPPDIIESNVRRLSEPGALTAALNWYRALELSLHAKTITVPTLYLWGDQDMALGEKAALDTANFVSAPYRFERLAGVSHWLVEEQSAHVTNLLLEHLRSTS